MVSSVLIFASKYFFYLKNIKEIHLRIMKDLKLIIFVDFKNKKIKRIINLKNIKKQRSLK